MLANLKGILNGGRSIDAIWGSFVRTKSKDGFYRMYKMIGNELRPLRAARTSKKNGNNGVMTVVREKYSTGSRNINASTVTREYDVNGARRTTFYETHNYDNPYSQLRDNDVTNLAYPQMRDNGGIFAFKNYGPNKTWGMQSSKHNARIAGTNDIGCSVTNGKEPSYLSIDELKRLDQWM